MQTEPHSTQRIDEEVCREHWQMLVGHALRRGCPTDDACEAVQELFLKLLESGQYDTLGGFAPAQQGVWLRRKLDWHLINRHRAKMRVCRGSGSVPLTLEMALHVAGPETPETLHDLGVLAAALQRAGVTEDTMFRDNLTGGERTRLSRWKKRLRRRFQHFLS
ncbi:RNA polymerase sigma factor [Prosthecobacter sp.]|uniref:RNA polymerase sigma factor n=1 Tax=Prosthecobacter sp. TaxID=1965333 RepID=UPI003783539F